LKRLADIIKLSTDKVDTNIKNEDIVKETEPKDAISVVQETVKPLPPALEEKYKATGTINASLAAMAFESPLQAWNGIRTRLRRKKAKRTIKDPKELENVLERIDNNGSTNLDVISLDEEEFKHIERIFQEMAKMKQKTEPSQGLSLLTTCLSIMLRRIEILVDED